MVISEWWIWKDLKESGRGIILKYYPSIRLEGLSKIMKILNQDCLSPGWDLNLGPSGCEAGRRFVDVRDDKTFGDNDIALMMRFILLLWWSETNYLCGTVSVVEPLSIRVMIYEYGAEEELLLTRKIKKTRRQTCFSDTLSTTDRTWTDVGTNPGFHGEKSASNRLNYDTAHDGTWGSIATRNFLNKWNIKWLPQEDTPQVAVMKKSFL
jgi:hypothetical protein